MCKLAHVELQIQKYSETSWSKMLRYLKHTDNYTYHMFNY
jgi:hypothetical protein